MLEFKIIQELKPNAEILEIIKSYTYKTKKGKVKHLLNTNLKFVEPIEYIITHPKIITILEYKVNELTNHLILVSKNAEERLNKLMESYKETDENLYEKSKETNQI